MMRNHPLRTIPAKDHLQESVEQLQKTCLEGISKGSLALPYPMQTASSHFPSYETLGEIARPSFRNSQGR